MTPKLDEWLTGLANYYRKLWMANNSGHWISTKLMHRILIQSLQAAGHSVYQDANGVWHDRDHPE